jgi:octaprenyl-diphosphate synthase
MTATIHRIGRDTPPSLDPLMNLVAEDHEQRQRRDSGSDAVRIPLIPELAGHLIAGGGKRMRPMLTLACAGCSIIWARGTTSSRRRWSSSTPRRCCTMMSSMARECAGAARRANIIWGNSASVLVGDFLFSRSFELMVEDGSLKVLKILAGASA